MRSREKNTLRRQDRREAGQLPPLEYIGHRDNCGCGCQLTGAQWLAWAEDETALATLDFRGSYTC